MEQYPLNELGEVRWRDLGIRGRGGGKSDLYDGTEKEDLKIELRMRVLNQFLDLSVIPAARFDNIESTLAA